MRIIIAGAGKLGFSIAQLLAEDQFDVVVVEIDPKRKEVVQNSLDVLAIEGNSCSPTIFADPDVRDADVIIACTDSDEVNMVTCLLAKKNGIKHVTLMPIMMVAGDHANNDMAGSEPDSHKSILEKAGYKVDAYIHGIGENAAIRDLYAQRAEDAWNALEK